MQCPFCGQDRDRVVDSRSSEGGKVVRRRRQCEACHRRFTTYERVEETLRLAVIKKDGSRETYDRQKLITGLERACYKRPITDQQIRRIVEAVEESIFQNWEKDVPSSFIGDAIGGLLQEVDKVAYMRFASVYRAFSDVGELIEEAQEVKDRPTVGSDQRALFEDET
ncbi:MAG TPA: transcriptional regulator NrdR [Phycisphaerae bacterium]|nr:transcriptional regulator NrdR [Phycisphaerae bacterium]